ncbi:MAG: hypothetical protein H0V29_06195 [Thermoleophilaceae bacterium]|nr:hypothetical protein [Thermoleophilaceae bacterium]
MEKRRPTPGQLQDAVRETVERTVQGAVDSAQETRSKAQDMVDDVVKGVRGAIEDARPATGDELREVQTELARVVDRLDAIERRLPPSPPPL